MKTTTSPNLAGACTLLASEAPDLSAHELAQFLRDRRVGVGTAPVQPGRLLDVRETAARLSLGERTVWRLANDGHLARVEFGKSVRFREADVAKLARTGIPAARRPRSPNRRAARTTAPVSAPMLSPAFTPASTAEGKG